MGELQGAKAAASSWHSNVEPDSLALKLKLGEASLVRPSGPEVIVVVGPTVSTVNSLLAAAPTLSAGSVAWTSKVWAPSARSE